ncbi:MAG: hypothetical protein GTO14_18925 [Anaerolineales bacterium]|nr:hypothetical protein [Anaerolineales bacterium]
MLQINSTRYPKGFILLLVTFVILMYPLAGCSAIGGQVREDEREEELAPEGTSKDEDREKQDESERSECPQTDVQVLVDYVHIIIMRPPEGEVKLTAPAAAEFFVTFRGDGSIDSNDYENRIPVFLSGTLDDCTIEGEGELSATFTGTCKNGFVNVDIVERLHGSTATMTCPEEGSQTVSLEGLFSAPEELAQFELKGTEYSHVLEADVVAQSLYYSWTFKFGWEVEPLAP